MEGFKAAAGRFPQEGEFAYWERVPQDVMHASRELFDVSEEFTKSDAAWFFMCKEQYISSKEAEEVQRRVRFLYEQLASYILKDRSPGKNFQGELTDNLSRKQGGIQLHDVMHAAIMHSRTRAENEETCIPTFLQPGNLVNDETALREELDALLFSIDITRRSDFVILIKHMPGAPFEEVFGRYLDFAFVRLEAQLGADLKKLDPPLTDEEERKEKDKFKEIREKILADMNPETVARAKRIYDGFTKDPDSRVLLDEFLAMTEGLPDAKG